MRPTRVLTAGMLCAGALSATVIVAPAANAATAQHDGDDRSGVTTVVLDPAVVPVLVNTVKVRPVAPGTITAPEGVTQAQFPISEIEGTLVEHRGGLAFTPVGGGSLQITRFDVDLGTGFLNATASVDGHRVPGRVDVFRLGPVRSISGKVPPCAGTAAGLSLTPQAATALGAPSLAGAFVGDACLLPGHDEDD